jgi:predicted RNA-binding Zn-ribbon protein involved in translation (DUF1610 family)
MIRFPCPSCGTTIKAPDELARKTGKCKCGEIVRIPTRNPFDQAMDERQEPEPPSEPVRHLARTAPIPPTPTGELIFCYACKKQVADNATACPKCGAVQTPEGREKGRQIRKQANIFTTIVVCVLALPVFLCCLGVMFGKKTPSAESGEHPGWDMERVRRDADEVADDPSKSIFVPRNGSQPFIVPKKDPP